MAIDKNRHGPAAEFDDRIRASLRGVSVRHVDWKGMPYDHLKEIVRILGGDSSLKFRRHLEKAGRKALHRLNQEPLAGKRTCVHCGREMPAAEHVSHEPFCRTVGAQLAG